MSIYFYICAILACIFGSSLADNPIYNCANAPALPFQLDKINGAWYEIARSEHTVSQEKDGQCAQTVITVYSNGTGKYEFKFRKQDGKKLGKEQIVEANFKKSGNSGIELTFGQTEPKVELKLVFATADHKNALVCAITKDKNNSSGGWILSRERKLDTETKKLIETQAKAFSEFTKLTKIEQDEKKCSGVGTTMPVVGVLLLAMASVFKLF